jgi:hypothetical protein
MCITCPIMMHMPYHDGCTLTGNASLGTHKPKRFIGAETGVLSVYMDELDDGAKQAHVAGRGRGRFHRFHVSKREQARVSPAISRDLV